MRSPFPGMDPYLEARWGDVHSALCIEIRTALQPDLRRGLRARAEEEVVLEDEAVDTGSQLFCPDLAIIETGGGARGLARGSQLATVEPIAIERIPARSRNRWVEIVDTTSGNRVVTAIEILSPGNKLSG